MCDRLNSLTAQDANASPYDRYFRWVQDAADVLQRCVIEDDVRRFVLTDGFRLIAGASLNTATSRLVYVEIEARRQQWTQMLSDISSWRRRWRNDQVIIVPDTNVLLQHEEPLTIVPWRALVDAAAGQDVRVVLPLVVLDQLDGLKRGNNFPEWKKRRLRLTVNWIRDNLVAHEHRAFLHPSPDLHGDTTLELLVDDLDHVRHPIADNEIVDRAQWLAELTDRPTTLLTGDAGMLARAYAVGVSVRSVDLPDDEEMKRRYELTKRDSQ